MSEIDPFQQSGEADPLLQAIANVSATLGADSAGSVASSKELVLSANESHSSLSELRATVAARVADMYATVRTKLQDGTPLSYSEREAVPDMAEYAIDRAVAGRNGAMIDEWMLLLRLLPRQNMKLPASTMAPLYAKVAVLDHDIAERELNNHLDAEVRERQRSRVQQLRNADLQCSSTGLTKAAAEYLKAGKGDEGLQLIDQYSLDDYDKVAQYVKLLQAARENNATPQEIKHLEESIAFAFRLMPSEMATKAFGARLMEGIHDENTRVRIIDAQIGALRNMVVEDKHYITEEMINDLLDGCVAAAPGVMGVKQQRLVAQVGEIANLVARPGFAEYKLAGALAQGAAPRDVVKWVGQLMAEDERRDDEYEYPYFVQEVDATLLKYAQRYIDAGDYDGARALLAGISDPFMSARGISYGLAHAEHPRQAMYMQVDPTKRTINPELATHWQLSDAMAAGRPDLIEASLRELVNQPTAPYVTSDTTSVNYVRNLEYGGEVVQQALEALPPGQRMRLVRDLKATLARAPRPSLLESSLIDWRGTVDEQLTEALARLGDPATVSARIDTARAGDKPEEGRTNWRGWLDLDKLLN